METFLVVQHLVLAHPQFETEVEVDLVVRAEHELRLDLGEPPGVENVETRFILLLPASIINHSTLLL